MHDLNRFPLWLSLFTVSDELVANPWDSHSNSGQKFRQTKSSTKKIKPSAQAWAPFPFDPLLRFISQSFTQSSEISRPEVGARRIKSMSDYVSSCFDLSA